MKKESVTYKNVEKSSEGDICFNGYLNNLIDLKIRNSLLVYTFINGAVKFFNLSSVKELLDGINTGNISIISKPDLKIGKDIISLSRIALVYKKSPHEYNKIYESSLLTDELKIAGFSHNIESIIRTTISKMIEDEK